VAVQVVAPEAHCSRSCPGREAVITCHSGLFLNSRWGQVAHAAAAPDQVAIRLLVLAAETMDSTTHSENVERRYGYES
jgi:hypothetical protein